MDKEKGCTGIRGRLSFRRNPRAQEAETVVVVPVRRIVVVPVGSTHVLLFVVPGTAAQYTVTA